MVLRGVPLLVLGLAVVLSAIGPVAPGAEPGPGGEANVNVDVSNFAFTPSTVTIDPGDSVTWDWVSGTHSVETSDGAQQWCSVRSSGDCTRVFPGAGTYDYRCGVHPSSMQATVIVAGTTPDLTVTNPTSGQIVQGTFTATGTADHPNGITSVAWRIDAGPYQPVDSIASGPEGVSWTADVPTTSLANGGHTFEVRAVGGDGGTSSVTVPIDVQNAGVVDLRVVSLTASDGTTSSRLHALIKNEGNIGQSNVEAVFEYRHHGVWHDIRTAVYPTIQPGQQFAFVHTWEADGRIGAFDVRVRVDPDDVVQEPDEGDNTAMATASFGHPLLPGFDPNDPI